MANRMISVRWPFFRIPAFVLLFLLPSLLNAGSFSYRPYMIIESDNRKPQVLAFSLGGGRLVVGYHGGVEAGGQIKVWDMFDKKPTKEIDAHRIKVTALAISPSGRYLASGGWGGKVMVHNLMEEAPVLELKGHKRQINTLAFSPDGLTLASAGKDKTIKLWDLGTGTLLGDIKGHRKSIQTVTFTPDGKQIISCSQDKTLRSWDVVSRTETRSITESAAQYGKLTNAAISPDGYMIATSIKEVKSAVQGRRQAVGGIVEIDLIGLRDFKTGQVLGRLEGHLETINSLDYSPDGRYIASAANDNSVMVWDVVEQKRVATIDLKGSVLDVDFSSDGRYLAAIDKKGGLYVYSLSGVSSFPLNVAGGRSYNPPDLDLGQYEGQPRRIAVMELRGKGKVDKDAASILTDSLRNFLQQTGRFEVVDRQNMKMIMKEMKLQLSAMVDEDSAVEMGRLLGAKGLVLGSVSKLGDMYAINLQMTSIATGRVLATSEERCRCAEEDLFLAISTSATKLILR